MKNRWWIVVALCVVPALVFAVGKKDKKVPALFGNAQYVYVESEDGDLYTPGLLQEDRQAIIDVEDSIRAWKRYTLTAKPEDAQLMFIVRKGRVAGGKVGGGVGNPGPVPQPPGQRNPPFVVVGGETGPADDLLEVRTVQDGKLASQIWFRTQPDGLISPRVPLMKELRDAVDRDYPL